MNKEKIASGVKKIFDAYLEKPKFSTFDLIEKDAFPFLFLKVGEQNIPIYSWRTSHLFFFKGQLNNLKGCTDGQFSIFETKDNNLYDILYRELDFAEWFFDEKISKIVSIKNGNTMNSIITLNDDHMITLELSTTKPIGSEPTRDYKIWGNEGYVTNRPIHSVIQEEPIYLYTESPVPKTFTDSSILLFDYSLEELDVVSFIYFVLSGSFDVNEIINKKNHLEKITNFYKKEYEKGDGQLVYEAN